MAVKYLSNRVKDLKVGISNYSESKTSVSVVGGIGIGTADTNLRAIYAIGNAEVVGILTATSIAGISGSLTSLGVSTLNVTGVSTFSDDVSLTDNTVLQFGDSKDLKIYHTTASGGYSAIVDEGTGQLAIGGNIIEVKNAALNQTYATIDGSGIDITGHTETDTFNVSGVSTFTGIVTTGNDLYVGGDLYVSDDIVIDELTARNLNVTGVSTFAGNINANGNIVGDNSTNITGIAGVTATTLTGTLQTAAQPNITSLGTLTSATVSGTSTLGITSATNLEAQELNITGVSTFGGNLDINAGVDISGGLDAHGNINLGDAASDTITVAGKIDSDLVPSGTTRDLGSTDDRWRNLFYSGVINSTVATGTAPFVVSSITRVDNLNADLLDGRDTSSSGGNDVVMITDNSGNSSLGSGTFTLGTLKVGTAITAHAGVITATTFDGNLATTNLTGTITNAQLAGSIANNKLVNDSVSYGGVEVDLGASDDTPAFDLQDATNYPYTSLTGITTTIVGDTTPQLGGNLDGNSKSIFGVGVLTATSFSGTLLTAAQTNITSLGTLSAVTVSGNINANGNIVGDTATNISGINQVTATTFVGDGSGLTNLGIPGISTSGTTELNNLDLSGNLTVAGVSTFQNNVHLLDNDKLQLGGSTGTVDGLEIYHSGDHSYIKDSGTGALVVNSDNFYVNNAADNETLIHVQEDVGVKLYDGANTKRFETLGVGVTVYGNTETQTLNVTGVSTFANNITVNGSTSTFNGDVFARSLTLTDNGTSTNPILLIKTDDQNPWGFQVRNDTYGTGSQGFKVYQSNAGVNYIQTRGTSARGRLIMQQHNGTTTNDMIEFTEAGEIELHHQGNERFRTTGIGVSVIGAGAGRTAYIEGPDEIWIDPHPYGVGQTSGMVRIRGDLYVDGTEFIVDVDKIELGDFQIGIATTAGTNALLDGAGIGIGSTGIRKFITWNNATSALMSSENWNLASGKHYEIAGTDVLTSTTLGSGVVNSSLTSVGTLSGLTVDGDLQFTGQNYNAFWDKSVNALQFSDNAKATFGNHAGAGDLQLYHDGSNSLIDNTTGTLYVKSGSNIHLQTNGKESVYAEANGQVKIYFNGNERLKTTSTGAIVTGILTASSFSGGGISTSGTSQFTNLKVTGVSTFTGNSEFGAVVDVAGDLAIADTIRHIGDSNTKIRFPAVDTVSVETAGSERLRIHENGAISAGVDNDSYELTLQGKSGGAPTLWLRDGTTTGSPRILFGDTGAAAQSAIYHKNTGDSLNFYTGGNVANGDERLTITSGGNIGIGTVNPTSLLTVGARPKTTSAAATVLISPASGNASIQLRGGSPTLEFDGTGGGNGQIFTDSADLTINDGTLDGSGNERLRITSGGNLLLNTTASFLGANTSDGSDNKYIAFAGGGAVSQNRGAIVVAYGNEESNHGGTLALRAGNSGDTNSKIEFSTSGSERLRITSTGNVGIGSLTPDQKLVVAGNIEARSSSWFIARSGDNSNYAYIKNPETSGSALAFNTSGEKMRITSAGKVGINTTSPGSKLEVWADDSDTNTDVFSVRGKTSAFNIRVDDADAANPTWTLRSYSTEPIAFAQGTDERLRITSNGTVIAGATSVSAGNRSQYSILAAVSNNSSATGHGVFTIQAGANSSNGNEVAQLCFSDPQGDYAWIQAFADAATGAADKPGRLVFSTTADGATVPTERLRITSDGNVGINTTLKSIAGMSRYLSVSARNVTNGGAAIELVGARTSSDTTLGVINFVNQTSNVAQITAKYQGSTTSGSLQFFTSGSERLRITSAGKIGIGTDLTTTPSSVLTVAPHTTSGRNISIYTSGAVGNKAGLFFNATSGTGNLAEIQAEYKGTNSGDLIFNTSMGERLRITSGGRVNIGQASDVDHTLCVAGTDNTTSLTGGHTQGIQLQNKSTTDGTYSQIEWRTSSGGRYARIAGIQDDANGNGGQLVFLTETSGGTTTEALRITSGGLVGIGTDNPDTLLHAEGSGSTGITFEGSSSNTNHISGDAGTYLILKNKSATDNNFSNILGVDAGGQATSQISFISEAQSTNAGVLAFATRVASGSMTERLRIASDGAWGLAGANYGSSGQVLTSNGSGSAPTWQNQTGGSGSTAGISTTGTSFFNQLVVSGISTFHGQVNFDNGDDAGKDLQWQPTSDRLAFFNDVKATFGNSATLSIYQNGTNGYLSNTSGNFVLDNSSGVDMYINSGNDIYIRPQGTENGIKVIGDGAVELYHNNIKRLETTSGGVMVSAPEGGDANLYFYADEGDDNVDKWLLQSESDGFFALKNYASASWETSIKATGNGAVELYFDNSEKIRTTNTGVFITGVCTATTFYGDGSQLTGTGGQALIQGITVQEEGSTVGTGGSIRTLDFVGGNITASASGTKATVTLSDTPTFDSLSLTNTDTGSSAGPIIDLYRNSASPADADYLGQIKFQGENDAGQKIVYSKITGKILDASDGTEDGILEFAFQKAGSNNISGRFRSDSLQLLNGTNFTVAGDTTLSGNVGIGSDTFTSQLEVARGNVGSYPNGNAKPTGASIWNNGGDTFTGRLFVQGSALSAQSDFLTGFNNEGAGLVLYDYGNSEYMQKWFKNSQTELYYNGGIRFATTNTGAKVTSPSHDGGLELLAGNNNQSTNLRLQSKSSGGTSYDWYLDSARSTDRFSISDGTTSWLTILGDGKVGINTVIPGTEFEVLGSGTVATFKGTGGNAFIGIQDVDSGNSAFIGNEDGGLVFQTPSSSYSTKMTITHGGDVGIGITNPSNTLVLKETDPVLEFRRNFGSGTSDIGSINFGNNNIDSDLARITVEGDGATDNAAIVFKTQASGAAVSERLRITSAGKVGIGTNNPDALLHLQSASSPTIHLEDTSQTTKLKLYSQDTSAVVGTYSNHPLIFTTNSTERLRILSGGNVAIGTDTDSTQRLGIYGTNAAVVTQNSSTGTGNGNGFYMGNGNGTVAYLWNYENEAIRFATNNTEKFRVDQSGRVVISNNAGGHAGGSQFVVMGGAINNYASAAFGNYTAAPTSGTTFAMFRFNSGSTGTSRGAEIIAAADANWTAGSSYPTRLIISTTASGATSSTERLRITSVGICSITTPGNTADGTYYSTVTINNTGSSTWSRLRFDRSGVAKWGLSLGTDDTFRISNLYTGGSSASPDDDCFVIANSSKVGIGSDVPTEKLDVAGTVKANGVSIIGNAYGIEFKTASANSSNYIKFNDHSSSDDGRIQYEHSTDEFLFLTGTSWRARLHADYFKPETTNEVDLGVTGQRFKNLWLSGNANIADDKSLNLGNDSDLYIKHSNGHAANFIVSSAGEIEHHMASSKKIIKGFQNSGTPYVNLYHNDNIKLTTTSAGITVTGTATATDFDSTSDIRLKTNIEPIDDPLAKVIQIEGVSFNWKEDNKPALGVIADQVEEIIPEIVRGGPDTTKTVNYNGLIGLLIEAVKEQQTQIDGLKERLSKLE